MKELRMKVANDNGNSAVKMIIDEGKPIIVPNIYAKVRTLPNNEELREDIFVNKIMDNLITAINSKLVSGTYFIGDYARDSGQVLHNMQLGIFGDKTESEVYPITTLSLIAGQAVKATQGKEEEIKVIVDMVGAIPVNQYKKVKAENLEERFREGSHVVTVHLPTRSIHVTISFNFVRILPEGIPPAHYLESKKTHYKDQEKKILHINIGEGTTELPITNGVRFKPTFIKRANYGVGNAVERLLEDFKAKTFMSDSFTRQQFMNILNNETHKFYAIAKDMMDHELEVEAHNILREVLGQIKKSTNEIDCIFTYGGGAILMRPFLEEKIKKLCENIHCDDYYASDEESTLIEVLGMRIFMESEMYQKIYRKVMKDRAKEQNQEQPKKVGQVVLS